MPSRAQASMVPEHFVHLLMPGISLNRATLNLRTFLHRKQHSTARSLTRRVLSFSRTAALSQFGNNKSRLERFDTPIGPVGEISMSINPL